MTRLTRVHLCGRVHALAEALRLLEQQAATDGQPVGPGADAVRFELDCRWAELRASDAQGGSIFTEPARIRARVSMMLAHGAWARRLAVQGNRLPLARDAADHERRANLAAAQGADYLEVASAAPSLHRTLTERGAE